MVWRFARQVRFFPWKPAAVGVGLGLVGVVLARWGTGQRLVLVVGGLLVVGSTAWWVVSRLVVPVTTGVWVARRDEASEHAGGVASRLDIAQFASASAMRRTAGTVRPSLAGLGWWARHRVRTTGYAVRLVGGLGWVPAWSSVWSSCEDVTLRIGGPRMGKSGSMACHIIDAPGAVVVTSSRTDLLEATAAARQALGRVVVFNPTGLGGVASTVRWSPLSGCTDLGTAQRRAGDLLPGAGSAEAERWDAQARGFLTVLLTAAALGGGSMRTVLDWISPADTTSRDEVLAALGARGAPARALAAEARSTFATNDRTLTSITATMLPALRWLADPVAATVGDADPDEATFLDVPAFVGQGAGSLYLVGRAAAARPLVGALTAEIAHHARMGAATRPGGRLDPPLTLVLDEAPLTCGPIPLGDWTADMGGRGVTLHIGAQSLAQLRDVWSPQKAETILGNTAALLVFGGLKAAADLEQISTLTGTRLLQLDPDDRRHVPVMTPAQITGLPKLTALVLRTGLRPVIGRAPMVWDRDPTPTTRALTRTTGRALVALRATAKAAGAVGAWAHARHVAARHSTPPGPATAATAPAAPAPAPITGSAPGPARALTPAGRPSTNHTTGTTDTKEPS